MFALFGLAAAAAVALVTWAALAGDAPPKIDGAKYCEAVAGMMGSGTTGQTAIRDGCLRNEADYATKLSRVWLKVPSADRDSCQKLLAFSQSSNQGLAGCIGLAMGGIS